MTKQQLKNRLEEAVKRQSKLHFVKALKEYCNTGLARAKLELADLIWPTHNFNKDFETLWKLLTKEEKSIYDIKLKYYDTSIVGED
jgi:hypothetical protein